MPNNGIDILSIDAKDIFISNNYVNKDTNTPLGYNIRFLNGEKKGDINTKKFINTMDESLDLFKIREVYEKVYRNTNFSFEQNGHEYTTKVINLTFKYSNKIYNKIKKNTYVKFGYNINDIVFKDHVCIYGDELVAIEINQDVESPISSNSLTKFFYFEDGQYRAKPNIKSLNTVQNLRKELYNKGFYCDGIKYVRYKRSGGSARVGKCLFIDERLYKKMIKWAMCGLTIKEGQEVDLAGLEAQISLPLSSIIDTIEIYPENFLVIDDYESIFTEDVIETRLENDWLKTDEQTVTIKNSIWDGQSLMDNSLFEKYPSRGMLLLRNKFFKSACFNCNIQKWFKNNNITEVSQLNGFTVAKKISDIKIITTPSSIKYLKYASVQEWFNNIESLFGIVKYEKPTHFFDGRMVQTHYQLLNTLQMSESDMRIFMKPTLSYLKMLKTDPAVLRYHIKYPSDIEFELSPLISKNDIVYRLLGLNERFSETKLYDDFKNDLTKSFVKNLRCGHVLVNGNYSTLLGNPVEMLMHAIGTFDGITRIGIGNIHCKRFAYGMQLLGSRSPHVTIGNIWLPQNVANEEIDKYFNLSHEIVCINSIGESVLDRLSGCDFDSDTVLLTDNQILIDAARKNYHLFKVPVNHVPAVKRKRKYTSEEKADLDIKTSDNKIGDIINLSQELNTILWDKMNNGSTYDDIKELYYDICQLDVMSGIEIDKAKKEYTTDTYKEMQKIKDKWILRDEKGRMIKPNFFGHLAKTKGFYDTRKKNYKRHNTSMDYLQKIISQFQTDKSGKPKEKRYFMFSDILNMSDYNIQSVYYDQVDRVLTLIEQCNSKIKAIYADESLDKESKFSLSSSERQECVEYIGKLKFSKSTMIYLLTLLDTDEYKKMSRNIMNILFGYPNTSFFDVVKQSKDHISIFMELPSGKIDVFGYHFDKITVA